MINPFRFRPDTPDTVPDAQAKELDGDTGEWADNGLSNAMAWGSRAFLPSWCDTPDHWTSRLKDYLDTSCPCCLFFRGLTLGLPLGLAIGLGVGLLF